MRQVPLTESLLSDRSIEVTAYLKFLKVAVERRAVLKAKDGAVVLPLSQELTHTLKANLVLLLYSATEATLIQLLDEMHEVIGNNCSSADALNGELLRVVLKTVKTDKNTTVLKSAAPLHQSLFSYWITDWQGRTSAKDKRIDGISGSVDGLMFYKQLRKFGVVAPTPDDRPPSHLTSPALQVVKKKRNLLAHGETSFTDLGRDLSVETLEADSLAVFNTLHSITAEVDKYLRDQRYLAQPPAPAAADTEA
ncbi:MAG: MAE_28990/MAE_18760 family HEPN-like nuclease [Zoogloea sp.]|uniref:MAE_28990/MAE_18760 family HEPN-like nuclease n=1 Tax=Zoogloea sp. TaxID=49181 RepID=UPI0026284E3B|nr:MAE_28990/MAE_18760 family HEPN-like nuclease [Zoogloea sp.]MDD2991504.1 MAE_28990/MAE_18760 family HEPN-like nuclease [Zoogloea sp.]